MKKEKIQKLPEKIVRAFNNLEIKECEVCGKFISGEEFKAGEGACFRCWDNPKDLK